MQPCALRDPVEPLDPRIVVAAIEPACRDMAERGNGAAQAGQLGLEGVEVAFGPGDEGDAVGMIGDILQRQRAFAFLARILPRLSSRERRP